MKSPSGATTTFALARPPSQPMVAARCSARNWLPAGTQTDTQTHKETHKHAHKQVATSGLLLYPIRWSTCARSPELPSNSTRATRLALPLSRPPLVSPAPAPARPTATQRPQPASQRACQKLGLILLHHTRASPSLALVVQWRARVDHHHHRARLPVPLLPPPIICAPTWPAGRLVCRSRAADNSDKATCCAWLTSQSCAPLR